MTLLEFNKIKIREPRFNTSESEDEIYVSFWECGSSMSTIRRTYFSDIKGTPAMLDILDIKYTQGGLSEKNKLNILETKENIISKIENYLSLKNVYEYLDNTEFRMSQERYEKMLNYLIIITSCEEMISYYKGEENNMKLIYTDQEKINTLLKEQNEELLFRLKNRDNEIEKLREELSYYHKMSDQRVEFNSYQIFKNKLNEFLESGEYQDFDIDYLKFIWDTACKDNDIEQLKEIGSKLIPHTIFQDEELLARIEEQNDTIQELYNEIESFKDEEY